MRNQGNKPKRRRGPGRPANNHLQGDVALLNAAQTAFARRGFDGASLRGIAAAAGVDPALVSHYFGSKDALWGAVVERMAQRSLPLIAGLEELNRQVRIPIRIRLGSGLWQLISAACEEPEFGMFLSRVGVEGDERLKLLLDKLVRPHHDAFRPILLEAMRKRVIGTQPPDILYFMLLQAISMTVSYRHILDQFGEKVKDMESLKRDVMQCVYATFLERNDVLKRDGEPLAQFAGKQKLASQRAGSKPAPR